MNLNLNYGKEYRIIENSQKVEQKMVEKGEPSQPEQVGPSQAELTGPTQVPNRNGSAWLDSVDAVMAIGGRERGLGEQVTSMHRLMSRQVNGTRWTQLCGRHKNG